MKETEWDIEIKPHDKLLSVDFKELWRYRDLCSLFIRKNIVVQYKQTILGPLWYLIQPMLTVVMFMVVFGGIAGIPTDGVPQPLFYLGGICLWQYFSDCLNATSNTFVNNAGIFGKVYFPRLIMPISSVLSNLLRFGIQFGLFIVVYIIYAVVGCSAHLNLYALLFPLLVLMMACAASGVRGVMRPPSAVCRSRYRLLGNKVGLRRCALIVRGQGDARHGMADGSRVSVAAAAARSRELGCL